MNQKVRVRKRTTSGNSFYDGIKKIRDRICDIAYFISVSFILLIFTVAIFVGCINFSTMMK